MSVATRRTVLASAGGLGLALASQFRSVIAQEATPGAEEEGELQLPPGVALTILAQLDPGELPQGPATLNVARLALEPGAEIPPHPHAGLELGVVEAGSGSIRTVEGAVAQVVRAGAEANIGATPQASAGEVTFAAGDVVLVPAGNVSDGRAGDEGATLLLLEIVPAEDGAATPEG